MVDDIAPGVISREATYQLQPHSDSFPGVISFESIRCLTRCEEQTLWKAGRREKCAGNDPFLPSRLPNLLCIKRPDMQGNLHRAPSSSRGWRPRRGSIRICGSHFSAVLHEARHRTSRRIRGGKFFGVGKSCHAPRHVLFSPSQIGNAAVAQLDRASDYESEGLRFDSSRLHHPADPPDVFVADAAAFSAAPRRRSLRRFARSGCRKVTQPVAAVRAAKHSGEGLCRFPPHCLFVQTDCENRIRPDRSTARGRGARGARLLRGRL